MKAALVIMAAGMGSRYGGVKQIEAVGPNGEILMEYAIHDAVRAGFTKVVFIIKADMETDLRELVGDRVARMKTVSGEPVEVCYAVQDFSSVPAFYSVPAGRTKPFGTVHALLCASAYVHEPFAVINADDYYGISAYATIYGALCSMAAAGEGAMVGYYLKNTVSPSGTVTRGVCARENGFLSGVTETYDITLFADGSIRDMHSAPEGVLLDPESLVSMNLWGFAPWFFGELERYFHAFLRMLPENELKRECLLPSLVDELIHSGALRVAVLDTDARWFGMTYKEDRATVVQELARLHARGEYPPDLRR